MPKNQTEIIRVRLPKNTRAMIEIEAEKHHADISKIMRKCIKFCFSRQDEFEAFLKQNGLNNHI